MRIHDSNLLATAVLLLSSAGTTALAAGGYGHDSHHHDAMVIGQPGRAAEVDRVVAVRLEDNRFTPRSIQVKRGETVKFVLDNRGRLLHEFNIGTAAMHADHRHKMGEMMRAGMLTPTGIQPMEHGHHGDHDMSMMKHDDPNSVLLEPGQQQTLIWTFDTNAELQFACNVPGHYESGMWGRFSLGQ